VSDPPSPGAFEIRHEVSSWVKFERANVERVELKVESKTETRSKALERKFRSVSKGPFLFCEI
jgi:hypothetical protein